MNKLFSLIALSVVILLSSCEKEDEPDSSATNNSGNPATNQISMRASTFSPRSMTISVGTTLVWTNNDVLAHTVKSSSGAFSSGSLSPNETFSFTFQSAGTYAYFCEIHPAMTGTVIVQ
jgi:plastocyanin